MPALTIGKVARLASVKSTTVRYYERRGLLPAAMRTVAGYRLYTPEAVQRLHFIRHAQELGFSLREIEELLELLSKKRSSAQVCEVTRAKIAAVEGKIEQLKAFRKKLQQLTSSCNGQGTAEECVIMKHLFS